MGRSKPKQDDIIAEIVALWLQLGPEDRAIVRGVVLSKLSWRQVQVSPGGRVFTFVSGRVPDMPRIIGQE